MEKDGFNEVTVRLRGTADATCQVRGRRLLDVLVLVEERSHLGVVKEAAVQLGAPLGQRVVRLKQLDVVRCLGLARQIDEACGRRDSPSGCEEFSNGGDLVTLEVALARPAGAEAAAYTAPVAPTGRFLALGDRPDLWDAEARLDSAWPRFVLEDPVGKAYSRARERFADWSFVLVGDSDEVLARVRAVPTRLDLDGGLPYGGWDSLVLSALSEPVPNCIGALEVTVAREVQGTGLSRVCLSSLRDVIRARGFGDLVAPVRPIGKAEAPCIAIDDYLEGPGHLGLPLDRWLRVHVRLGGVVRNVAPHSMLIPGTYDEWFEWTGVRLGRGDAPWVVPGGLVPLMLNDATESAVYCEPNVWVHHKVA